MRLMVLLTTALISTGAQAASTARQDALLDGYFAILDDNRNVTPDTIARLYARHVIYYGHAMDQADLLRDKLAFVRRWPNRRYAVAPGTATRVCDAAGDRCELSAVIVWTNGGGGRERHGRSRIRLTLARQDGALKIVRESAVTLG